MSVAAVSSSEALRGYARRQIDCADTFLLIHAEAGLSLCRCGRLHPCADRRYWLDIRAHYEQILSTAVPPRPT